MSTLTHKDVVGSLKAVQWERCKGELRGLIALDGSTYGGPEMEDGRYHFQHLQDKVDAFIAEIEDEGLHE